MTAVVLALPKERLALVVIQAERLVARRDRRQASPPQRAELYHLSRALAVRRGDAGLQTGGTGEITDDQPKRAESDVRPPTGVVKFDGVAFDARVAAFRRWLAKSDAHPRRLQLASRTWHKLDLLATEAFCRQ
jgi:hypothetical protein